MYKYIYIYIYIYIFIRDLKKKEHVSFDFHKLKKPELEPRRMKVGFVFDLNSFVFNVYAYDTVILL